MDLYFAGSGNIEYQFIQHNFNRLQSYLNEKTNIEYLITNKLKGKLFIDSGAFTAWTKGKIIDVDAYINWLNDRSDYIYLYGQLDSIPGDIIKGATREQVEEAAEKTWQNYLYMRPKMNNPDGLLYTFHVGEPYKYLKQALQWRDENNKPIAYIALGGMVGKPMPVKKAFLDTCFEIINNSSNPNVKVHAFGMTSFDLLEQYPITSADSTSWIMTAANGGIMTDVGIINVSSSKKNLPEHYSHLDIEHQQEFNKKLEKYGFTLNELAEDYKKRELLNMMFMQEKANNIVYKSKAKPYKLF